EDRPVEVDDAELQEAVDSFRRARGLATPEQTERWLTSRGLSLADLEDLVSTELYEKRLRRRVVGEAARAAAAAAPEDYDDVTVAMFAVPDEAEAIAAAEAIERGEDFFRAAEGRRATIRFDTFARAEVAPLRGDIGDGAVLAARLRGAGPYVCRGARIAAAAPEAAVEAAERRLFADWLRARREAAHVEWHWS